MIVTTKGRIGVAASREAVWEALHDVERIAFCVPGCRQVTRDQGDAYLVAAFVRFGPVRLAFDGVVEVSDFEAPSRLALTGRGRGGLAGSASGTAVIDITERPEGCRLSYELQARTDGAIAQLGTIFLTGLAGALSELFARRFAQLFVAPHPVRQGSWLRSRATSRSAISLDNRQVAEARPRVTPMVCRKTEDNP